MSWGFTAITTVPAPCTASRLDAVASIPCVSARALRCPSPRAVATISSGLRQPESSRPAISDSPILPAPRIAMRLFTTRDTTALLRPAPSPEVATAAAAGTRERQ